MSAHTSKYMLMWFVWPIGYVDEEKIQGQLLVNNQVVHLSKQFQKGQLGALHK
jgi:hypothetical protein